jgi:hypothetical protein
MDIWSSVQGMFSGSFSVLGSLAPLFFVVIFIVAVGGIVWFIGSLKRIKKQWTHKLFLRRKSSDGTILPEVVTYKLKRFVNSDGRITKYFQTDKPLFGSNIIVDLGKYSAPNTFSIIVDEYNRIWINEGEKWNPTEDSINVSARHAEIDLAMEDLTNAVKVLNTVNKKRDWTEIAKTAMKFALIIGAVIIAVYAMQTYAKESEQKTARALAEVEYMKIMDEVATAMQGTVNTQQLEITFLLQKAYGTQDLQRWLNEYNSTHGGNNTNV